MGGAQQAGPAVLSLELGSTAGPFLRFQGGTGPDDDSWVGSVLFLTRSPSAAAATSGGVSNPRTNGSSSAPQPTLMLVDSNAGDASSPKPRIVQPVKLDEVLGWAFWRFEIELRLVPWQRPVQYSISVVAAMTQPTAPTEGATLAAGAAGAAGGQQALPALQAQQGQQAGLGVAAPTGTPAASLLPQPELEKLRLQLQPVPSDPLLAAATPLLQPLPHTAQVVPPAAGGVRPTGSAAFSPLGSPPDPLSPKPTPQQLQQQRGQRGGSRKRKAEGSGGGATPGGQGGPSAATAAASGASGSPSAAAGPLHPELAPPQQQQKQQPPRQRRPCQQQPHPSQPAAPQAADCLSREALRAMLEQQLANKHVLGLDPGSRDTFTAVTLRDSPSHQEVERLSTAEHYHRSGYTPRRGWQERKLAAASGDLRGWQSQIPSARTADPEQLVWRVRFTTKRLRVVLDHYGTVQQRKQRWRVEVQSKRLLTEAARRLTGGRPKDEVIVGFGNASCGHGGCIKGRRAPVKRFRRHLEQFACVVGIDEYRTSQLCSRCIQPLRPCRTEDGAVPHALRVCTHCRNVWNRDVNAANNMLALLLVELAGMERPAAFVRPERQPADAG